MVSFRFDLGALTLKLFLFLGLKNTGLGFVSMFKDMWQQNYPVKSLYFESCRQHGYSFFPYCKLTQIPVLFDSLLSIV